MRQKELRIALVCYGGISLAVYMHGVTKELWHLARASRAFRSGEATGGGTEDVYLELLRRLEDEHGLRLRVLPDIVAGASAGGINGVFLAQAVHSGQSLEPLTRLWLEFADVDILLDPDARPGSRLAKLWAMPLVWFMLRRDDLISASVAPETRAEVRSKLSRLIRSRWFEPPFGGLGFSRLIARAFEAMAQGELGPPLLPPRHPLDLFVTATDFSGHRQVLRLNTPPLVEESEHRLSIGFCAHTPEQAGGQLAHPLELIFAARATASFPGAFPALQIAEIDALGAERRLDWPTRDAFLARIMPEHARRGDLDAVALIDGSVLNNAPFGEAMGVLGDRPAQREVDRRFVYIDPHPGRVGGRARGDPRPPSFFSMIFGSLSSIPREQPIRDSLEEIDRHSREVAHQREIVARLRPEVEDAVERLFGRTLFFDRPTVKRLTAWRARAQQAAAERAGYAFDAYEQVKLQSTIDDLARLIHAAAPQPMEALPEPIARRLSAHLDESGLVRLGSSGGGASPEAIRFFREHDLAFRIRRLRLLARRLTEGWDDPEVDETTRESARDAVYRALSLYFDRDGLAPLGAGFPALAARVLEDPAAVLAEIATRRQLPMTDLSVDAILADALAEMPVTLRRRVLLSYLGCSGSSARRSWRSSPKKNPACASMRG
ncbi:MAG: patatin-like protein [Novosphingobium sp.]|nr:patatin-like protein [Novosphingobium sp.]